MDIAEKVKGVIAAQLEVDVANIADDASLMDDLGADSLALVEVVLKLEEEFDVDIADEETDKIRTVRDAITFIQERVKK